MLTVDTLIATVDERATWRKRRSEEHSDDARHAASARSLRRLASWIQLNAAHPSVRGVLAVQTANPHVDLSRLGESSLRCLGGLGFGATASVDPVIFLVRLAFTLQDDVDRYEQGQRRGRPSADHRAQATHGR